MPPVVIDLIICALILLMTYVISSEGLWGAALVFFNVLFAGIIALNFYEPLAKLLAESAKFMAGYADMLCLSLLFIVALVLLRLTTETLAPAMVRFPTPIYHAGRFLFAIAASMITIGFLIVIAETGPLNKKAFGTIDYNAKPPFHLGLDHQWLGFFQYTTGQVFAEHTGKTDPYRTYGDAKVFDPRATWLLNHQEARPYGTESYLGSEGGGEGAAAPAQGAAAPAAPPP
jgi:hypothetical protein